MVCCTICVGISRRRAPFWSLARLRRSFFSPLSLALVVLGLMHGGGSARRCSSSACSLAIKICASASSCRSRFTSSSRASIVMPHILSWKLLDLKSEHLLYVLELPVVSARYIILL